MMQLAGHQLAGPKLAGPQLAGPRLAGPPLVGSESAGPHLAEPCCLPGQHCVTETAMVQVTLGDILGDLPPVDNHTFQESNNYLDKMTSPVQATPLTRYAM